MSSCSVKLALRRSVWYGPCTHFARAVSDGFAAGTGIFAPLVSMAAESSVAAQVNGMPRHRRSYTSRVERIRIPYSSKVRASRSRGLLAKASRCRSGGMS